MRWQATHYPNRFAWWSRTGLLLAAFVFAGEGEPVWAQGKPARGIPPLTPITDHSLRPAVFAEQNETKVKLGPEIDVSTTEIRTDSPPVPGAKLALEAGRGALGGRVSSGSRSKGRPSRSATRRGLQLKSRFRREQKGSDSCSSRRDLTWCEWSA